MADGGSNAWSAATAAIAGFFSLLTGIAVGALPWFLGHLDRRKKAKDRRQLTGHHQPEHRVHPVPRRTHGVEYHSDDAE